MNDDRVAGPHEAQQLVQLRPVDVFARQPIGERLIEGDAVELALWVLQLDGEDLSAAWPIAFPGACLEDSGEQVVARWGSA